MPTPLRQRKVARVVFDESHGEAWSIRPDAAAALRPEHPGAASYAAAAEALAERDFEVAAHVLPMGRLFLARRRRQTPRPGAGAISSRGSW